MVSKYVCVCVCARVRVVNDAGGRPNAFVVSMQHCSEIKDVFTLKYEVGLNAMNTNKNIHCNQFML
jgi:hypothetical protein